LIANFPGARVRRLEIIANICLGYFDIGKLSEQKFEEAFLSPIRSAVQRTPDLTPGVTMRFPKRGPAACEMTLQIQSSKVGELAKLLFDVGIILEEEPRCIAFENGVKVYPRPEVSLRGKKEQLPSSIFGTGMYSGIGMCKEEYESSLIYDVSMQISDKPNSPGLVRISFKIREGVLVAHWMYLNS
jgi:hypothetical protein